MLFRELLKDNYYWVRFAEDCYGEPNLTEWTVGFYEGDTTGYPWKVVGSDDIFQAHEIAEVGARIERN